MSPTLRWEAIGNAVEVLIPQRTGLRTRDARLRAMGTTLQAEVPPELRAFLQRFEEEG